MSPIPDDHRVAFEQLVVRARQLFGSSVEEALISPDNYRLPSFRVDRLSMIGEQWIVVEISSPNPFVRNKRWELDWDLDKAIELLEWYHSKKDLGLLACRFPA